MEDLNLFRLGYIQLFDRAFDPVYNGTPGPGVDYAQQQHIHEWFARYGDIAGALAGRQTPEYTFHPTDPEGNRRTVAALYAYGRVGYARLKEAFSWLR